MFLVAGDLAGSVRAFAVFSLASTSQECVSEVSQIFRSAPPAVGRKSVRAATRPRAKSTPPMTLNTAKQAQGPCQSERCSSGAACGDYEACVPFKQHWILFVAAWKTTSPQRVGLPQDLLTVLLRNDTRHVPISQEERYFSCSGVSVSISTFIEASLSLAISLSMGTGTG